ncbi:histone-lysine N-methyltransferase, H3 lysine-79 specific isoform X2 [Glossina fuscipes]|uniref:Histone-lysine N-methyltransferase, H3 lysine-79 specific n=1 Tax=Glossina fuscipes TaxID=7396 RepID=A0A9C6DUR5_9MUSC|nr:histone-lysine N-methyltransferase, H3 lysine-79 specific isoform X2 [Glossina fuscipes]
MATPQVKDLVLRSPAGSSEVITFTWPLQVGSGQDRHDNGIDIIDTIKFVCDELPSMSSAFEEINLNKIDTACYKTMTNLVDRFNKAVDSIVALEKGTSLPAERLNKFAHPSLLRHILQLVYNAAVLDPDKLNQYEPFSPEVYGETSYELVQQMIKHVNCSGEDTFIDLGSGVGQVVLQMAGSFPLKSCLGIEKADTPSHYADRMDMFFRQFMAWFGKRYCEYKLIKGDFLVDEHREKITSSSLVFVNNFAFGPNVDHQLKERFADLRDGARVVSSKSFCPLNFRITDRNLSDIGTIMHVSEIPPLKGSVSWTCKPVSYYLHVIDRTILERYFQRLKTQKGADNDHVGGSTRTTRDRAKREANNHALSHSYNSNSSNSNLPVTNRTNSPAANVMNNTAAATKTRQQQQQPRNLDMDTSTESEGDAATNGNSNGSGGPSNARKTWSDWGSSKGKSSQSDEEENNNFISAPNSNNRSARSATQKKRKKLARKVAIANKNAAVVAQAAAAKERADSLVAVNKDNLAKDETGGNYYSTGGGNSSAAGVKGRKGRMKKGARGRKTLKIAGLEMLHKETVLSTSVEAMSKKLPPAPGCVDQQLTSLLTENMAHKELDIPTAPQDTPYALQILLDVFRSQYMAMIEQMKSKAFIPNIKHQIQLEQERKQRIKNRASQLDKQIKVLIDDSVALLKVRMNELGINVSSPNDLIAKAKEIVGRHKELQGIAKKIQSQVTACEVEQRKLLKRHLQHLPEYQRLYGGMNGKTKLHDLELSEAAAHELVLKEIANTLTQRKKLVAQVSNIEKEASTLEKAAEDKRTAAALMAQGTNITLSTNPQLPPPSSIATNLQQPLQLTTTMNSTSVSTSTSCSISTACSLMPNATPAISVTKTSTNHGKTGRRSRDHRSRSQEWPDVPDVGKIEESNPEVLAQKILETGRKIEAGKFNNAGLSKQQQQQQQHQLANSLNNNHHHHHNNNNNHHPEDKAYRKHHHHHRSNSSEQHIPTTLGAYAQPDPSTLMPAPKHRERDPNLTGHSQVANATTRTTNGPVTAGILPKCELPGIRKATNAALGIQESPKVANFEDRLKSIITSALNEDQEHRKAQHQMHPIHVEISASASPQQSPVPKRSKQTTPLHIGTGHTNNSTLSNIISVATHGMTHLNATTTISPITPPLPPPTSASHVQNNAYGAVNKYSSNKNILNSVAIATSAATTSSNNASQKTSKYHQHVATSHPYSSNSHNQDLSIHRRRSSVSAANYEQFMAAQQQQQQHHHLHGQQHQQQVMMNGNGGNINHHQVQHAANLHPISLEFKAPPIAANNVTENHLNHQQRSGSREVLLEQEPVRASSANSDSALTYYPPTRDRLMSLERSVSRESAVSQNLPPPSHISLGQQPPSRPSSNSSQPDYTQVSPAKMALRRHLSQEKLNQQLPPTSAGSGASLGNSSMPMSTKTIGDLVNGEIERTLEITHQSIINAAVNMSTVGTASGERNPYLAERSLFGSERDRDRSNERERLIINPNAQRPERVHVRVVDDHNGPPINAYAEVPSRSTTSGRKSPYAHNLATLAHVAYQHKTINGPTNAAVNATNPISASNNNSQRHYNNGNPREREVNNISAYHHLPTTGKGNQAVNNATNAHNSSNVIPTSAPNASRDYQPVALPRAEMKPCIEAYFQDEHQNHNHSNHIGHKTHTSNSSKERHGTNRNNRLNGGNPPLEGLAASLQDRMLASRKFKEEHEERQRRVAAAAAAASNATTSNEHTSVGHGRGLHNHHHHLPHSNEHYGSTNYGTPTTMASTPNHNNGGNTSTPMKVELGVKRTSPMGNTSHQPRPAKIPHYSHEAPNQNPIGLAAGTAQDDIIADDETHWQHRVSSGFDRLVAFASTELDKTRRSIDTDTVPSSISCNTSPDSGITHSSSNSEASRTFLSTSSTSSQLDLPISSGSSTSSSGNSSFLSHHPTVCSDHLSDSSMKSENASLPTALKRCSSPVDPTAIESPPLSDMGLPRTPSPNASTVNTSSPPPPPLTNALINSMENSGNQSTNNLKIPLKYQRKSKTSSEKHYKKKFCERNWEYDCDEIMSYSNSSSNTATDNNNANNATANANLNAKGNGGIEQIDGIGLKNSNIPATTAAAAAQHKSSKFRPKGKDWDWSLDSGNSNGGGSGSGTQKLNSNSLTTAKPASTPTPSA